MTGARAEGVLRPEAGGHRWQRVPPNDKRGRVQTSTVTVAVLAEPAAAELTVHPSDLEWAFSRGSGPGGQNRNKTETAVDLTHRPTGLVVHCESERSQLQNKAHALAMLRARLWAAQLEARHAARGADRRAQIGCGARGDKRWTVSVPNGVVTHHPSGAKIRLRDYLEGDYAVRD